MDKLEDLAVHERMILNRILRNRMEYVECIKVGHPQFSGFLDNMSDCCLRRAVLLVVKVNLSL
jgi:hypothetical protein